MRSTMTLNYTPVVQIKTVPTRLVLEYAFAAHRTNNGYIKENHYQLNNRTLVDYSVKHWINETQSGSTLIHWLPNEFSVPEITDSDRAAADEIDEHFKKYMFNSLAGKLNQFETDVYSAICGEEVELTKVGLIAYVPELINRDRKKWQFEKTVKSKYKNSSFDTTESVDSAMTILRVYDFKTYEDQFVRNVVLGLNGNLYCFYDKKKSVALDSEGSVYHIKGRVKTEAKERTTGATMTRLNYVKAKLCLNQ